MTSITITANPLEWSKSLSVVVQEMRALCDHGITEVELERYKTALLKDHALAKQSVKAGTLCSTIKTIIIRVSYLIPGN